jgi:LPXTG-site transpeptidase (sortase) family protein
MSYLSKLTESEISELFSGTAQRLIAPAALVVPQTKQTPVRRTMVVAGVTVIAATIALANLAGLLSATRNTEITQAAPAIATPAITPTPATADKPVDQPTEPIKEPSVPLNTVGYNDVAIAAPIRWNIPFTGDRVDRELELGVVHIGGTALPGQQGTVVLFGHSSSQPWSRSAYKTVFASLHDAKIGQSIEINRDNTAFTYVVTKIYEVNPDQLETLNPGAKPGLRLMTCTPIGTSLRRLVVEADQISPNPSKNTPFTPAVFTNQLPGD